MTVLPFKTPYANVEPGGLWPDPLPLPSTLLPVPAFDPTLLPPALRAWAVDAAERMNCPLDYVAIPAMIAAGSLIGRRVGIRPERNSSWTEAGNLWGTVVGQPGSLKSPSAREALMGVHAMEELAATEYAIDIQDWQLESVIHKIAKEEAEKDVRNVIRNKDVLPENKIGEGMEILRSVPERQPPAPKRFVTNDATPEKLGEICGFNPAGVMIHRDEIMTLFTDMDREEKAAGRGFLMVGWTGLDGYTVDRIGRGTVRIPAVNLSMFGTTQPVRLMTYMRQSLRNFGDGFVQRVQLLAWPDPPGKYVACNRPRDEVARDRAMECFLRLPKFDRDSFWLDDVPAGEMPWLNFDDQAQALWGEWREGLEAKIRDPDMAPALAEHLSKYRGLIPRLALIYHLCSQNVECVEACGVEALSAAIDWADHLEAHARRAYAAVDNDRTDVAEAIIRRIRKGDLGSSFSCRDIYRRCWANLKDRGEVEAALKLLVDYDWLSAAPTESPGRPTIIYSVNPKMLAA